MKISEEKEASEGKGFMPKPEIIKHSKNWSEDVIQEVISIVKNPPKKYTLGSSFYEEHVYNKLKNENRALREENEKLKKELKVLTEKHIN